MIATDNMDTAADIGLQIVVDADRVKQIARLLVAINVADHALKACEEYMTAMTEHFPDCIAAASALAARRAEVAALVKQALSDGTYILGSSRLITILGILLKS